MKTKALTILFTIITLQISAHAENYPADSSIQYDSQAQAIPDSWGLSTDAMYTVQGNNKVYPPTSWGVADLAKGKKVVFPRPSRELRHTGVVRPARVTFYNPDKNNSMEGGANNRYQERVNAIEDAIKNGRPVTVAADYLGAFGSLCNDRYQRCTLLIRQPGFDIAYPSYRRKFPNLPKNTFIAMVEDTGSDFYGTAGKRFDIASRSKKLYIASPAYLSKYVKWVRMVNPCGSDEDSRLCNLSDVHVSGEARSAMGLGGRDI